MTIESGDNIDTLLEKRANYKKKQEKAERKAMMLPLSFMALSYLLILISLFTISSLFVFPIFSIASLVYSKILGDEIHEATLSTKNCEEKIKLFLEKNLELEKDGANLKAESKKILASCIKGLGFERSSNYLIELADKGKFDRSEIQAISKFINDNQILEGFKKDKVKISKEQLKNFNKKITAIEEKLKKFSPSYNESERDQPPPYNSLESSKNNELQTAVPVMPLEAEKEEIEGVIADGATQAETSKQNVVTTAAKPYPEEETEQGSVPETILSSAPDVPTHEPEESKPPTNVSVTQVSNKDPEQEKLLFG